ncbi:DUF6708 domain-containing protein [Caldimonas brevitalea]|uniref:DUF6708 domain-containing protein n=1 Tax=Caldimonas brevitalea TaxID=413882 RepID=A0A0G3BLR0_9BURK|nr:DUF6708 domain-containing protein [Caldimonas brevitalea]AKJ30332.1 hypothetical protein AAW51_3641 [Caldimonas brevitalea]
MTDYIRRRAAELHNASRESPDLEASKAKRLDKRKSASDTPRSLGLLQQVYERAISLEAAPTRTRGIASVLALLFVPGAILGILLLDASIEFLLRDIRNQRVGWAVLSVAMTAGSLLLFLFSLTGAIRTFRIDLLSPLEMPILFIRKARKVYRFVQKMPGDHFSKAFVNVRYWPGVFKRWPLILVEYDWDCLEAEYAKETRFSGNVVQTLHELRFVAKESRSSARIVDGFTVGPPLTLGSQTWAELWEFIRRYMEEQTLATLDADSFAP